MNMANFCIRIALLVFKSCIQNIRVSPIGMVSMSVDGETIYYCEFISLICKCEKKNTFLWNTYDSKTILIFFRKTFSLFKSNFPL